MAELSAPGPQPTESTPPLADFRFSSIGSLISPSIVAGSLRALEAALIAVLGYAIYLVYVEDAELLGSPRYLLTAVATGVVATFVFQLLGLYRIGTLRSFGPQIARLGLGWTLSFGLLVVAIFFFKAGHEFSRVWLASWYMAGGAALAVLRAGTGLMVRHWTRQGRLLRRTVIVGAGNDTAQLIEALESDPENAVRICGIFDDRGHDRIESRVAGYPVLGTVAELVEFGRRTRIDLLIVCLPMHAETRLLQILKTLWVLPVDIRLAAHTTRLRFTPRAYSYIGSLPFISLADKPIADWNYVQKWLFDKIVGSLALILLSPVMLATALAIKLDSRGPVLFKQKRYGFNNELIEVWKFRSMYVDKTDADASKLVTRDDPRVTRVGRFIRKTSIDELPQLFNVIAGTLSLVGPRPHALQAKAADQLYQDVVDGYFARHKVKPGLTGWAQINGWRGETDTAEKIQKRVEYDLYYIDNWSVLLDLYILVRTPFALLKDTNAY